MDAWRRLATTCLASALVLVIALPVLLGAADTPSLTVKFIDQTEDVPVVDGVIDDAVWSDVAPYDTFTQQEPIEGAPATERTEVRLLLSRETLYIGIICFDSDPSQIVFTQSRRDADLNDTDSIQVVLDTFNDSQNGFVFGTNPAGLEYDGQVAGEGLTGGFQRNAGGQGSQRGQISGFNPNWDGDWMVRSRVTARGWETELAIPLKTLRYIPGSDKTWGINVMRNLRRKNEQSFLAPIPRGYNLHRVSLAAKVTGLTLPSRRDLKFVPYVAGHALKDIQLSEDPVDRGANVGLDVKWGVTPTLTADFTVNTDFAQVEADDQQINLTRFPVFFPEKRPFFLENAGIFQFGNPQQVDIFFSRRIGLSDTGLPIDIFGGARMTGKVGAYNIGVLEIQTEETFDPLTDAQVAPANNFAVGRIQREVGRSNFGAIFVNRQATSEAIATGDFNRTYGVDTALQVSDNGKVFAFLARSDSPGEIGSDWAGRAFYTYTNPTWQGHLGLARVGDRFNPEVGFLSRRGHRPEARIAWNSPKPKAFPAIRRFFPHITYSGTFLLDGDRDTTSLHLHALDALLENGGRFGYSVDFNEDHPLTPFAIFTQPGKPPVIIPPGLYDWWYGSATFDSNPSAPAFFAVRFTHGGFYDGTSYAWETNWGVRMGDKLRATVGYNRNDVELPGGSFTTVLLPVRVAWSFSPQTTIQGLVQYNSQAALVSSNIRFAMLDRSGTGFFIVYNERYDTLDFAPEMLLGRSVTVKYTRLFDF
jgi:Domain of unknown function (DUF5916)